jgi:hypothetical protein
MKHQTTAPAARTNRLNRPQTGSSAKPRQQLTQNQTGPVPKDLIPLQKTQETQSKAAPAELVTKPQREHHDIEPSAPGLHQKQAKPTLSIAGLASNETREAQREKAAHRRAAREQRKRNVAFERAFGEAVDNIFPENQTRERLSRLAHGLAKDYAPDQQTLARVLRDMRLGAEASWVHVEKPRLFPDSPITALKWLRIPKIAIGDKPRKWGDIRWKKDLVIGELRVQQRRLFPHAPRWSPLNKLEIPALHFSFEKSKWKPKQSDASREHPVPGVRPGKTKQRESEQSQTH